MTGDNDSKLGHSTSRAWDMRHSPVVFLRSVTLTF